MNLSMPRATLLLAALLSAGAVVADAPADYRKEAEAVVLAFNAAFERKDVEGLAAQVMDGGVKFDLRPAHAGQVQQEHKLIQELKSHWSSVTPIVFSAAKSYTRKAEILETRAAADMATVWARVTSEMLPAGAPKASKTVFTEVYFLVRTPQGWKIYDIVAEGVSLVLTYRSEFDAIVRQDGVDGLIKRLSQRNTPAAATGATAGSPSTSSPGPTS